MAKKISKHSRAARRGQIESTEAKELSKLPKVHDLKKTIIRTTIMNENLLNKKLEKKSKRGKSVGTLRQKLEKNSKLQGILDKKIDLSIKRHKFVSTSRKSNWDQINSELKQQMDQEEDVDRTTSNKFDLLGEEEA